jgi:hypothetical protein
MAEEEKKGQSIECRLCRKMAFYQGPFQEWRNDIDAWVKVCKECRALWELGKKTAAATKTDGKELVASVHLELPTDYRSGDAKGSVEVRGKDIMTAMGGVSLRGTAMGDRWRKKEQERISIDELQDEDDDRYVGGGSMDFTVPKSRAEAMARVVRGFFNAIAKARVDGFNEGRNLLSALAKGEVSLEDYSEQADNARAGKKPRTSRY